MTGMEELYDMFDQQEECEIQAQQPAQIPKEFLPVRFLGGIVIYPDMPSLAQTGCRAGDIIIGICDCNRGNIVQIQRAMSLSYDPEYVCKHGEEDQFNMHNYARAITS